MTNTCSLLYYPGQDIKFGIMVGHADLEFEGTVYLVSFSSKDPFFLRPEILSPACYFQFH